MEDVIRAFNFVIEKGWAFYWGTSEWSAEEIDEAHRCGRARRPRVVGIKV
jgi:aryl-alcohol dehydrogenase-like predicted oxidoreductase